MNFELYDFQLVAFEAVRDLMRKGVRRIVLSSPTGSGKTVIAAMLVKSALEKGSTVEFIADRRALIEQASERFHEMGIEHGILMGANSQHLHRPFRISSAQTLARRGERKDMNLLTGHIEPVSIDLAIDDECHEIHTKAMDALEKNCKYFIGLTATPFPKALGKYYDAMVNVATTEELIAKKKLAPLKIIAPTDIVDVEGLSPTGAGGEFKKSEISKRSLRIVGNVLNDYKKCLNDHFNGKVQPTIVFCASIDEAEKYCKTFIEAGYNFNVVSSRKSENENFKIIKEYKNGLIDGIINCLMLNRGFDVPQTRILIDLYPLDKSLLTLIQRYGRVIRTWPGKKYGIIIDFAVNWLSFEDDLLAFYKYGPPPLGTVGAGRSKRKKTNRMKSVCKKCYTVFMPGDDSCNTCGAARPKRKISGALKVVDGTLCVVCDITGDMVEYRKDLWREICTVQNENCNLDKKTALRRAYATYKDIKGVWPKNRAFQPYDHPPDPEIKALVTRRFQAWMIRKNYIKKKRQKNLAI